MNAAENGTVHRILIIDDNPSIHKDFQTILVEEEDSGSLDTLRAEVFGDKTGNTGPKSVYELDFASQGKDGCEKVDKASSENRPYELAFVDMRMPPGWDGLKTIERIWKIDPKVQVVICTAYSAERIPPRKVFHCSTPVSFNLATKQSPAPPEWR